MPHLFKIFLNIFLLLYLILNVGVYMTDHKFVWPCHGSGG